MNILRTLALACSMASMLLLSHAGNGGGGGGIGGSGIMRTHLTDAPACGFEAVHVTVERLRVHAHGRAGPDDAGWTDIAVAPPKRIDLLTLQNGVMEPLGEAALAAGRYRQIRLVLSGNSDSVPMANAVTPIGQPEVPLELVEAVPGIRVPLDATVMADQAIDVVLDFDACRSVVPAGPNGRYLLKPVVSAMQIGPDGQGVVGYLDPGLPMASTRVSLQSQGEPVKETTPDASGQFVLYPVPVGQYDLVVSAVGRATTVLSGVPVDNRVRTQLNGPTDPIVPPVLHQGVREVVGRVRPAVATVRFLQTLAGGATVEVVHPVVDAATGRFGAGVPVDAPWQATYAAGVGALQPDQSSAGEYRVEARDRRRGAVQETIDARQPVQPLDLQLPR